MLGQLFQKILGIKRYDVGNRGDGFVHVAIELAGLRGRVSFTDIVRLSKMYLDGLLPEDVVDSFCTCGILRRDSPGYFSFGHEIWKKYFETLPIYMGFVKGDEAGLLEWISGVPKYDLPIVALLAAGGIKDAGLQDCLLNQVMQLDIEAYTFAVGGRVLIGFGNREDEINWTVNQLYRGYVGFAKRWFPRLMYQIYPWSNGDEKDLSAGSQVALISYEKDKVVSYYLGFSAIGDPVFIARPFSWNDSVFLNAPVRGFMIRGIELGRDGRRDSFKAVVEEVLKIVSSGGVSGISWFERERFQADIASHLRSFLRPADLLEMTVFAIGDCLSQKLIEFRSGVELSHGKAVAELSDMHIGGSGSLARLVKRAEFIVGLGYGDSKLKEIGLPVADLLRPPKLVGRMAFMEDYFSTDRKSERLIALFEAIAFSYKEICENYFGEISDRMFFSSFPCKPVVHLTETPLGTSLRWWWFPVKDWGEVKTEFSMGGNQDVDFEALCQGFRDAANRLGRPGEHFSLHHGSLDNLWSSYDHVVEKAVCKMVIRDLDWLSKLGNKLSQV